LRKYHGLFLLVASLLCFFLLQQSNGVGNPDDRCVESFDMNPREVKVCDKPTEITFRLHVVNANNESSSNMLPLRDNPRATFKSTFPGSAHELFVDFKPVSEVIGVYEGTAQINKSFNSGMWKLDAFRLADRNMKIRDLKNELETYSFVIKKDGLDSVFTLSIFAGLVLLVILFVMYYWGSGWIWPSQIYKDENGISSASKAQLLIWTTVALFSYTVIYADRVLDHNNFEVPTDIPLNLLLAMGLSAGTTLAANFANTTQIKKRKAQNLGKNSKGGIFLDENGNPDLSKIQMMAWTFLAVGIYVISVFEAVSTSFQLPNLPDINPTLLALMGIGEFAYVGKKVVTEDDPRAPRLSTISPERGAIGTPVILTGLNFGDSEEDGQVLIDDKPILKDDITKWSNTWIEFKFPADVAGEKMSPRETEVSLIVKDRPSPNPKAFEVIDSKAPYLDNINPKKGPVGTPVYLTGERFGNSPGKILIEGQNIQGTIPKIEWSNKEIRFQIPNEVNGVDLSKKIKISLEVNGIKSQNSKPFEVD
jgi:hypothetical protein